MRYASIYREDLQKLQVSQIMRLLITRILIIFALNQAEAGFTITHDDINEAELRIVSSESSALPLSTNV